MKLEKLIKTMVKKKLKEREVYKSSEFQEIDSAINTILGNVDIFPNKVAKEIKSKCKVISNYVDE